MKLTTKQLKTIKDEIIKEDGIGKYTRKTMESLNEDIWELTNDYLPLVSNTDIMDEEYDDESHETYEMVLQMFFDHFNPNKNK